MQGKILVVDDGTGIFEMTISMHAALDIVDRNSLPFLLKRR